METAVEAKIDEKFSDLKGYMEETDKKLKDMSERLDINDLKADENAKAINLLNQKDLQNKMEIVGAKWPEEIRKDQMKDEVIKVLSECKVRIDVSGIKSAYLRKSKLASGHVMVVEFADFETKMRVMKGKRQWRMKDGIYFDHALTPINGKLMGAARKIAREKNFKIYLNNNRINVKRSDNEIKMIESSADIEAVKLWPSNDDKRTSSESNGQSTSKSVRSSKSSQ
jgi:hypothetical protein